MIKNISILLLVCLSLSNLKAQSIIGKWKTIDDETGKARSIVEIYEENDKIYGKIVDILNPKKKTSLCSKCDGENKNQPVIGMVIINGLEKGDEVYAGGTILNPDNGKIYKCRLKLEEETNTLQVRGYLAFFYKTQYWQRIVKD